MKEICPVVFYDGLSLKNQTNIFLSLKNGQKLN